MNKTRLNLLSQKLSDLQAACQGKFSVDSETEAVFQELAAEIASHYQHHVCEQNNQLLYLEILFIGAIFMFAFPFFIPKILLKMFNIPDFFIPILMVINFIIGFIIMKKGYNLWKISKKDND